MNPIDSPSRLTLRGDAPPPRLLAALLVLLCAASAFAAPNKKDTSTADGGVADAPKYVAPALPADLNQASLRVAALDTLYELDLSADQLRALKQAAAGAGSTRPRSHPTNPKFASLLEHFQAGLLEGGSDQTVARLRGEVVDQIESVEGLDDQLEPTGPALTRAPQLCRKLRVSQIAAFLATHADEVSDPVERMVDGLDEMRLATAAEQANVARKISLEVGRMVAGLDQDKSKAVADRVMDWFKTSAAAANAKDELNDAQRAALEQSAQKVVGDVTNVELLDHWLQAEVAILLSNPQLPAAIDLVADARGKSPPHAGGGGAER